jgi:hypothetical protein
MEYREFSFASVFCLFRHQTMKTALLKKLSTIEIVSDVENDGNHIDLHRFVSVGAFFFALLIEYLFRYQLNMLANVLAFQMYT